MIEEQQLCPICEGTGINKKYKEKCCCNDGYVTVVLNEPAKEESDCSSIG